MYSWLAYSTFRAAGLGKPISILDMRCPGALIHHLRYRVTSDDLPSASASKEFHGDYMAPLFNASA